MLPPFSLLRPTSLEEALAGLTDDVSPYCGGTELLLAMRLGLYRPPVLLDLKRVPELAGIRVEGEQLVIGSTERHMDVAAHPLVRAHAPMLAGVENAVGNARVRAQGSMGGNLCFAEPKSDVGTTLIALDAILTLAKGDGRREVTVEDFIEGPYQTAKESHELLIDIRIPVRPRLRAEYVKYQTMERPTVGVAVAHDGDGGRCRLAVGAVGEMPECWTFDGPDEIDPRDVADRIDPTPDLTGSARYKRHVTAVHVRRALDALASRRDP